MRHWIVLLIGAIGWAALLIAEVLQVPLLSRVDQSLRYLLVTLVALGIVLPFVETSLKKTHAIIADKVADLAPAIERGFSGFVEILKDYDLSSELRELRTYLPHQVKYLEAARHFTLEKDGHVVVHARYIVRNISGEHMSAVILPIFAFDVGSHAPPYDELISLVIDGREIRTGIDSIRTLVDRSKIELEDRETTGRAIECTFSIPVHLPPGTSSCIEIKFRNFYCAESMHAADWVGARVYDITEKLLISIAPPSSSRLWLADNRTYPKAISVFHNMTNIPLQSEIARLSPPAPDGDNRVHWCVERPLIGYSYAFRYRVEKSERE